MYDLTELQRIIHRIYEGNVEYPESGEDYDLRTGFVNDAIRVWATDQNIQWKELYTNVQDAADGDAQTADGTSIYDTPSDFIEISSFIKAGGTEYRYLKNDAVLNALSVDSHKSFFTITGSPSGGYKINLNPTPDFVADLEYSYYRMPITLVQGIDKCEMSKPYFAVYHSLARLYELDNRNDLTIFYEQKAKDVMDEMIILNETAPFLNSNQLTDYSYDKEGMVFGK